MAQEHAHSLAVQRLLNYEVPLRAQYIRVLFREITRISNHLLALTTQAMDVGHQLRSCWLLRRKRNSWNSMKESREPGCMPFHMTRRDVNRQPYLETTISRYLYCHYTASKGLGISRVMLRGPGVCWDLRRAAPYDVHDQLDPDIPVGTKGDRYDRYYIRIEEMQQRVRIIVQCLNQMPSGMIKVDDR
ncbi:hypothetical protein ACH5RR_029493 [Cinchona calisaya]|uniref:NADH-quinone oxidoreductase subunit D domain-containing protein n=1 Tax=Cinchona calisaya TaxID=153742 RepID=A0ABD2YW93_9GENT